MWVSKAGVGREGREKRAAEREGVGREHGERRAAEREAGREITR